MMSQSGRKRREIRTVSLSRSRSGFGFTITGELPCRLGGVLPGSVADCAGLQSGDRLIGINGQDVSMLSHDEVVRRIGSCRTLLRLNVADHSSEDSSADSSDNAETYVGRIVNNGLHPRPGNMGSVKHQPVENMAWDARHNGLSSRNKYGRHIRSGNAERYHAHSGGRSGNERHMGSGNAHDHLDLHQCNDPAHGVAPRRKTKHTVITREVRIGLRPPERRPQHFHNVCDDSDDNDDDISLSSSELQVVVGYSGSVEMPSSAPRLAGSRLQSIRSAVNRLRATNRTRCLAVMDISADGIRLTDAMCRVVACYVTSRIAFCGICPDDRRFFGIVMTSGESRGAPDEITTSCHVFMVDPEIAEHHLHAEIAARFGLNCTMDLDMPRCLEFPLSAVPIISFLGRLYRHRKNTASFTQLPGNFCGANLHGIGEGKAQDDRVYVVDALKNNRDQQSYAGGNAAAPALDEENELFIHNLSVIEPVLADENLLNGNEPSQGRKLDEQKCSGRGHLMTRSLSQASSILRESNHHVPSSGLRRVTTTLDDNSFRPGLHHMPAFVMHSQPLRHSETDDDTDSTSSIQGNGRSFSTSPVPPPVPPKLFVSKHAGNSRSRIAVNRPVQGSAVGSHLGVVNTPVASGRTLPLPESCSASKPPLPERRPSSNRQIHKATGIFKPEVLGRPMSTPPVNKMSVVVPASYDSDPGNKRLHEGMIEQECITYQSDDNNSPEDLDVELVNISCFILI